MFNYFRDNQPNTIDLPNYKFLYRMISFCKVLGNEINVKCHNSLFVEQYSRF